MIIYVVLQLPCFKTINTGMLFLTMVDLRIKFTIFVLFVAMYSRIFFIKLPFVIILPCLPIWYYDEKVEEETNQVRRGTESTMKQLILSKTTESIAWAWQLLDKVR